MWTQPDSVERLEIWPSPTRARPWCATHATSRYAEPGGEVWPLEQMLTDVEAISMTRDRRCSLPRQQVGPGQLSASLSGSVMTAHPTVNA